MEYKERQQEKEEEIERGRFKGGRTGLSGKMDSVL